MKPAPLAVEERLVAVPLLVADAVDLGLFSALVSGLFSGIGPSCQQLPRVGG